jgi:hypothetical protein
VASYKEETVALELEALILLESIMAESTLLDFKVRLMV